VDARGEAAALVGASDPMMADTQEVLPVAARERNLVGRRFRPMPLK
jgi:hypothetical protein